MAKPIATRARSGGHIPEPAGQRPGKAAPGPRGRDVASIIGWSPKVRAIVSAAIVFHLAAVIVAALVAVPPYSPFWSIFADVFRPYINAADLNHGYRFFAPDPGSSHIVDYHLEFADGTTRDGRFPNLDEQWPRLLYHRYFMLSEHLNNFYGMWQESLERSRGPLPKAADRQELVKGSRRNGTPISRICPILWQRIASPHRRDSRDTEARRARHPDRRKTRLLANGWMILLYIT